MQVYLDNAASTPLKPEVKDYIINLLDIYSNPSSIYQGGLRSRRIIDSARIAAAEFINAPADGIFFVPSGSAANTMAVRGFCSAQNCRVLYSPIAHKSLQKCAMAMKRSLPLRVSREGFISMPDLEQKLKALKITEPETVPFVVTDWGNSEIGTIQNIKELIELAHFYGGTVYLDCTGSLPCLPLDVKFLDPDMAGFSGHKLGALKGCGVLYKKPSVKLSPLIYGSQEQGLCAGTENILGIASFGKAVSLHDYSEVSSCGRDYIWNYIKNNIRGAYPVGAPIGANRLPHNLYVCFRGVMGEALLTLLDMSGIQVSTGSACASGDSQPSSALTAIGLDRDDMDCCVRMSFSGGENREKLDYVCAKINESVRILRGLEQAAPNYQPGTHRIK